MKKLLIIEDEAAILEVESELFEEQNYEVISASSVTEGLSHLHESTFALVISDLFRSPEDFSDEKDILAAAGSTPVLIVSAWNLQDADLQHQGFAGFHAKPFAIDELLIHEEQVLASS